MGLFGKKTPASGGKTPSRLKYEVRRGLYAAYALKKPTEELMIPDYDGKKKVEAIGHEAFAGETFVSAEIPGSVVAIWKDAFAGCVELKQLTFSEGSLGEIEDGAFRDCRALTTVSLPPSLAAVGSGVFSGCTCLQKLTLPFLGPNREAGYWSKLNALGHLFRYGNETVPAALKEVTVLGGTVGIFAFAGCRGLEKVTIGEEVTAVYAAGFADCPRLVFNEYEGGRYLPSPQNPYHVFVSPINKKATHIDLHPKTGMIAAGAFNGVSVTSVNFPDHLRFVGRGTFDGCPKELFRKHEGAYYVGDEAHPHLILISATTKTIQKCTIPEDTRFILEGAFSGCRELLEITLPPMLRSLGREAFKNCTSLIEVTIPDFVSELEEGLFDGCSLLSEVTVGSGVSYIEKMVFHACPGLISVTFRDPEGWRCFGQKVDLNSPDGNGVHFRDFSQERQYTKKRYKSVLEK